MAEFGKLIRNEFVKLRHGKFLWVMVILLVVVSIGFSAIIGFVEKESTWGETDYLTENSQNELNYLEQKGIASEYDAWVIPFDRMIVELELTYDDWRYQSGAVREYAVLTVDGRPEAEELAQILRNDDSGAWLRLQIEEILQAYPEGDEYGEWITIAEEYCIAHGVKPTTSDWRYVAACAMETSWVEIKRLEAGKSAGMKISDAAIEKAKNQYALAKYRLENNVPANPAESAGLTDSLLAAAMGASYEAPDPSPLWTLLYTSVTVISLVGLTGVVIAAGIVANEFQKGTIKFLLVTPVRRWKILLAKYCTVMLITFGMTVLLFLTNLLSAVIICGGSHLFLPSLTASGGTVHASSALLGLAGRYLMELIKVIVSFTLAFAVSSLFRHSAAATAVSMFLLYVGNLVNQLLALFGADWGRYLIFANMDIGAIERGAVSYYRNQSLPVAIVVVVLHMIVFLLTAFDAFDRREV